MVEGNNLVTDHAYTFVQVYVDDVELSFNILTCIDVCPSETVSKETISCAVYISRAYMSVNVLHF